MRPTVRKDVLGVQAGRDELRRLPGRKVLGAGLLHRPAELRGEPVLSCGADLRALQSLPDLRALPQGQAAKNLKEAAALSSSKHSASFSLNGFNQGFNRSPR